MWYYVSMKNIWIPKHGRYIITYIYTWTISEVQRGISCFILRHSAIKWHWYEQFTHSHSRLRWRKLMLVVYPTFNWIVTDLNCFKVIPVESVQTELVRTLGWPNFMLLHFQRHIGKFSIIMEKMFMFMCKGWNNYSVGVRTYCALRHSNGNLNQD